MKITIEFDDNSQQVFNNISDAYMAMRYPEPGMMNSDGDIIQIVNTKSYSWDGGDFREILKELRQSLLELEVMRNASTS